jgi:RNA polymerase sigma factor (sigma-70 family)
MTSTGESHTDIAGPDVDHVNAAWLELGPAAVRLATVLVGPDDAHDVTVTAFLRVVQVPAWAAMSNQRAYLLRAVTNAAHDHRRQRDRRRRRDIAAVLIDSAPAHDPVHIDVRRGLAELSVEQRAVVFFTYWEDMTEAAIAQLLQISTGTVHRNLTRAKARLRRTLND